MTSGPGLIIYEKYNGTIRRAFLRRSVIYWKIQRSQLQSEEGTFMQICPTGPAEGLGNCGYIWLLPYSASLGVDARQLDKRHAIQTSEQLITEYEL